MPPDTKTLIGKECKFAVHIPTRQSNIPDVHLIKERLHYSDGTTAPAIRFIENFQRPFYYTKKAHQDHQDKKEWERKERLNEYHCTQSQLRNTIAKVLDKSWSSEGLRELCGSPYIYGADIASTTLIKHKYRQKWPDAQSAYTVAAFDVETDVLHGTDTIIIASAIFENHVFLSVRQDFVAGFANPIDQILERANQYIKHYIEKYQLTIEVHIGTSSYDSINACFKKLHEWKPDFLTIWNMDFDVPKLIEACEKEGKNPADLFCDPAVPPPLRFFKYKQGQKKLITASGKVKPIPPSGQWHYVDCPSSFYIIDSMCVYRLLRIAKQEEPSYSLEAILQKELKIGKLKFTMADAYEGLQWHQFMQENYKLEYAVYNIFDSLAMLELDAKLLDLRFTVPTFSGDSPFSKFRSQPSRISDSLYFYLLDKDLVLGTIGGSYKSTEPEITPEELEDEENGEELDGEEIDERNTLDLKNWISTLSAMMVADNGLRCIKEDPGLRTNIRAFVSDLDVCSSYPSCIMVENVSKETTRKEIIGIDGIEEIVFKLQNINAVCGYVNAMEYCTTMFKFPKPDQLLKAYLNKKK